MDGFPETAGSLRVSCCPRGRPWLQAAQADDDEHGEAAMEKENARPAKKAKGRLALGASKAFEVDA